MELHKEIAFEKNLAEYLAAHGWLYSPTDAGYDRERALFPEDVLGWLADTQPEQLAKVVKPGGDVAKQQAQLLDRIVKVLDTPLDNGGGTLQILRKGFSHLSGKFQMCVFKPESTLNEAHRRLRRGAGAGDAPGPFLHRPPAVGRSGPVRQRSTGGHDRAQDRVDPDRR